MKLNDYNDVNLSNFPKPILWTTFNFSPSCLVWRANTYKYKYISSSGDYGYHDWHKANHSGVSQRKQSQPGGRTCLISLGGVCHGIHGAIRRIKMKIESIWYIRFDPVRFSTHTLPSSTFYVVVHVHTIPPSRQSNRSTCCVPTRKKFFSHYIGGTRLKKWTDFDTSFSRIRLDLGYWHPYNTAVGVHGITLPRHSIMVPERCDFDRRNRITIVGIVLVHVNHRG